MYDTRPCTPGDSRPGRVPEPAHTNGRLIFLTIMLVTIPVVIVVNSVGGLTRRMATDTAAANDAAADILFEISEGHLWLEEVMSGDRNEDIAIVWEHFDRAERSAQAMLDGGVELMNAAAPLDNPELRTRTEALLNGLAVFRALAEERWALGLAAAAGTDIDQRFDRTFDGLIGDVVAIRTDLHAKTAADLRRFGQLQGGLAAVILLSAVIMILILRRYDIRRAADVRALADSEHRHRRLFETVADGVLIVDRETGRPTMVNPVICRMLGYDAEELKAKPISDLHPVESDQHIREVMQALRESAKPIVHEVPFIRKDGSEFPARVSSWSTEVDGRPHVFGFISDLSEARRAEQDKAELEAKLLQAQKMEAVGNLAGGIAHDFNNLLQAILGFSELVIEAPDCPAEHRETLKGIQEAGNRAAELTRQLLAFSRRQLIDPGDLDLNEVINSMLRMLQRLIGENIELKTIPGHSLGTVCIDRGQLEQMFMNLCLNARDAMGSVGTIAIETENVVFDSDYCANHPWSKPGRYVMLSVTDSGHGMSPEVMDRAFEPFFTTKDVGQGTGLGLATVYGIVKQNGGLIHVYSEEGHGTTFRIYLPLVERIAVSVDDEIEEQVPTGTETILLAEDDTLVRELACRFLRGAGYTVLAAVDGQDAVEMFEEHADAVDMGLFDVVMPRMGGREAQDTIRRARPDFKVLFSSGYSQNSIHTDFVLEEGHAVVTKPYERSSLLRGVRRALDSD